MPSKCEGIRMLEEKSRTITKTQLAKELGVSRQSLYYVKKRDMLDVEVKLQIEAVLTHHGEYGHKRIAMALKLNKKRISRIMKKYNLHPFKSPPVRPVKAGDVGKIPSETPNYLLHLCPIAPYVVWCADFTYIKYQEKFIYLATIIDLYTREIVGWNISRFHSKDLVIGALQDAVKRTTNTPLYLHSDQGSEYDSQEYKETAQLLRITLSMSDKASPWQNGHQESFFGRFKTEFGDVRNYPTLGELIEAIHHHIIYYNTERIHPSLKTTPEMFKQNYVNSLQKMKGMTV